MGLYGDVCIMSYIEYKTIKGNQYGYLRQSIRVGNRVIHKNIGYLGRITSIQDRRVSIERSEPVSKPIRESIGTRIKETTLPKTEKDKRTRIKLDVAIKGYAGYGAASTGKEPVRRELEEEKKKKKKLKKKLIIPTEEEMKKEKDKYDDMFFPLGS
jgi:hypothetical protein